MNENYLGQDVSPTGITAYKNYLTNSTNGLLNQTDILDNMEQHYNAFVNSLQTAPHANNNLSNKSYILPLARDRLKFLIAKNEKTALVLIPDLINRFGNKYGCNIITGKKNLELTKEDIKNWLEQEFSDYDRELKAKMHQFDQTNGWNEFVESFSSDLCQEVKNIQNENANKDAEINQTAEVNPQPRKSLFGRFLDFMSKVPVIGAILGAIIIGFKSIINFFTRNRANENSNSQNVSEENKSTEEVKEDKDANLNNDEHSQETAELQNENENKDGATNEKNTKENGANTLTQSQSFNNFKNLKENSRKRSASFSSTKPAPKMAPAPNQKKR